MIRFENNIAYICCESICCIIKIRDDGKAELVHFGAPVQLEDAGPLCVTPGLGWGDSVLYKGSDPSSCLERLPLFYSESGRGDYRESPIELLMDGKPFAADFVFESAELFDAAQEQSFTESGLPLAHGEGEGIRLSFVSRHGDLRLVHIVKLYETALTVRTVLENNSEDVEITKLAGAMLDLPGTFYMHTFGGGWIAEGHRHSTRVGQARVVNDSSYGFSSSVRNSGVMLAKKNAGEDLGEVLGINLLYSGDHYTSAQKSPQGFTRIVCGINPDGFSKKLSKGESFESPQVVFAYSSRGCNGMSENMHKFVLEHVVPKRWAYKERPIVYNSWEGCMFDFNENKLVSLAKKAARLGCETFVLDDGWFGARNSDTAGLGDYTVNKKKLPSGISGIADKIRTLGMDFGIWVEPEGVNPDSDLYRAHPDWAIHQEGLDDLYGRNELLLDLRRPEVRDYIVENVGRVIDESGASYIKWDMNRQSPLKGNDAHDYICGLYDILKRIFIKRQDVLLESCSSGGNRFDLGMLCFGPQVWTSDDTDPVERLDIQGGLSYLYPQSTMGAHVSASPHAQTLRSTPLSTRFNVAAFGALGYEMDLDNLVSVEESEIREQIQYYKAHRRTFQFGTFRRNAVSSDGAVCWQVSGEDEAVVGLFHRLVHAAPPYEYLFARLGDGKYSVESKAQALRVGQFGSLLKHVTPVELNPNGAIISTVDKKYRMQDVVFKSTCSHKALACGLPIPNLFLGTGYSSEMRMQSDFGSNIFLITKEKENEN